jgi:hypothetical protein
MQQGRVVAGGRKGAHQIGMVEGLRLVVGWYVGVRVQLDLVSSEGLMTRLVGMQAGVLVGVIVRVVIVKWLTYRT